MTQQDEYECDHCDGKVAIEDTKCPHCGEPFEADEEQSDFECSDCGGVVAAEVTHCPHCGETFEEETEEVVDPMVSLARSFPIYLPIEREHVELFACTQCGAPVRRDDKFCHSCGRALKPVGEPVRRTAHLNSGDGDVTCGECDAAIVPEAEVCPQCGLVFDPQPNIEATEISDIPAENGIEDSGVESECSYECEGCEQPVGSTDSFCGHCGRLLAPLS